MLSYQSADIIPRRLSRLLLLTVMRKRTDDFFLLRGDRSVVRGAALSPSPRPVILLLSETVYRSANTRDGSIRRRRNRLDRNNAALILPTVMRR